MIKFETMVDILNSYKKGTFVKVVWEKDIASAKARKQGISIIKRCEGVVRAGITYTNISIVKDILAGKTAEELENKRESWFTHCEEGMGLIQNKKSPEKKYIQLFFVNGKKIKSCVSYTNSEEVGGKSFSELYDMGYITKADLPKSDEEEPLITMTLSLDNLVSFGE